MKMEMARPEERLILDWPLSHVNELITKVEEALPKKEIHSFVKQVNKLDWSTLIVGDHSPEECHSQFDKIVQNDHVRKFRFLSEIVADAKKWILDPRSSVLRPHEHPDFPKLPMNSFMTYKNSKMKKMRAKFPELSIGGLTKKIKKHFEKMSPETRREWDDDYETRKAEFNILKAEFFSRHPEYVNGQTSALPNGVKTGSKKSKKKRQAGPVRPKFAFDYYCESRQAENEKELSKDRKEELRAKWNKMGDQRKAKYIQKAIDDQERYNKELDAFKAQYPLVTIKPIKSRVTVVEKKSLNHAMGRPDFKMKSTYQLFCKEFHDQNAQIENRDLFTKASRAWKELSGDEKNEYNVKLEQLRNDYAEQCEAYLQKLPHDKAEMERLQLQQVLPKAKTPKSRSRAKRRVSDDTDENSSTPKKKRITAKSIDAKILEYLRFENEDDIREQYPTASDEEIDDLIEKMYKTLAEAEKTRYRLKAEKALARKK